MLILLKKIDSLLKSFYRLFASYLQKRKKNIRNTIVDVIFFISIFLFLVNF